LPKIEAGSVRTAGAAFFLWRMNGDAMPIDAETINALKELGAIGWMGFLSWQIIRWKRREQIAKKNGAAANGNGKSRRMTDALPGNPGHTIYEAITTRLDGFGHRIEKNEAAINGLAVGIARIEGQLNIHD